VTYQVVFSKVARRDLHRVPPRIVPAIVEFIYGDLAAEPRRVGKTLERDLEGAYGARRGPYRVLYDLDDNARTVQILRIDHRSDVYRPR
jgi:mRNA interferase RelE/StbE